MPDIDDIWDDDEDRAQYTVARTKYNLTQERQPRLCRDIFDSNTEAFISDIALKIAKMKYLRVDTREGGDYWHTLSRYISMMESAKIAATAHRDISIIKDQS
jgi:hypothetical protein